MNNKKIYFASDFHLGAPNYEKSLEREKKIVAWLDYITPTAKEIFLVGDVHINRNFTHSECVECVSATESELSDNQLWAGLVGYKSNGKYQQLFDDAYAFSLIE